MRAFDYQWLRRLTSYTQYLWYLYIFALSLSLSQARITTRSQHTLFQHIHTMYVCSYTVISRWFCSTSCCCSIHFAMRSQHAFWTGLIRHQHPTQITRKPHCSQHIIRTVPGSSHHPPKHRCNRAPGNASAQLGMQNRISLRPKWPLCRLLLVSPMRRLVSGQHWTHPVQILRQLCKSRRTAVKTPHGICYETASCCCCWWVLLTMCPRMCL